MNKSITLLVLAACGVCGAGLYSCSKSEAKTDAPRGFDLAISTPPSLPARISMILHAAAG